jgi:AraC family transcriptional regulator
VFSSSEGNGWDGLVLRAYHEPMRLTNWVDPATPEVALIQLTRGTMLMEQRQSNGAWHAQRIQQGDLFLKPPIGRDHLLRWQALTDEPLETLHINLDSAVLLRTAAEMTNRDPTRVMLMSRSGFQDPLLRQIGLALWHELEQPTAAGSIYAQAAAQMLAAHLLRFYSTTPPVFDTSARDSTAGQRLTARQLGQVTDFVRASLDGELSLAALAHEAGFSPFHFARLFRRTTGESPHQFVLRQRIERAQSLLRESDLPVAHVALASGFANQSHLARAFKRHLGLSPAEYRRRFAIRARLYSIAHE